VGNMGEKGGASRHLLVYHPLSPLSPSRLFLSEILRFKLFSISLSMTLSAIFMTWRIHAPPSIAFIH
jgi:hypothetical protein